MRDCEGPQRGHTPARARWFDPRVACPPQGAPERSRRHGALRLRRENTTGVHRPKSLRADPTRLIISRPGPLSSEKKPTVRIFKGSRISCLAAPRSREPCERRRGARGSRRKGERLRPIVLQQDSTASRKRPWCSARSASRRNGSATLGSVPPSRPFRTASVVCSTVRGSGCGPVASYLTAVLHSGAAAAPTTSQRNGLACAPEFDDVGTPRHRPTPPQQAVCPLKEPVRVPRLLAFDLVGVSRSAPRL
jgi:hypothetical protein